MDFELNIYGANDEIVKTYGTNHIKWGVFIQAVQLQEQLKDADAEKQLDAISKFVLRIFDGMTLEEIESADAFDVMAVFTQLVNKAKGIKGGSKNE